jgi:hypothetical protein
MEKLSSLIGRESSLIEIRSSLMGWGIKFDRKRINDDGCRGVVEAVGGKVCALFRPIF